MEKDKMRKSQDQDEISQLEKSPLLPSLDLTDSFLMADTTTRRSNMQTVTHILSTDSIYHLVYILILFTASNVPIAALRGEPLPWWYEVYAAINDVLRCEICSFGAISLCRTWHDTNSAVQIGFI